MDLTSILVVPSNEMLKYFHSICETLRYGSYCLYLFVDQVFW